ncbi:MAG: hypothetical protein L0Z70_07100 [Chloroflexi bacterium]|nr:hypothetical protein [Chloroflexota bacterium]
MFKLFESRIFWGVVLILGGTLFLLENFLDFELGAFAWGILLALGALFFLTAFFANRAQWWAAFPGFTLLGVAGVVLGEALAPALVEVVGGSLVLGGVGLGFAAVYATHRDFWWAIIPAGVMFTLALMAGVGEVISGVATGGLFFLGLGATFAAVALLPNSVGKMSWAWYPAGALVLMGVLVTAFSSDVANLVWPIALIGAGLLILVMPLVRRSQ